MKTLIFDELEYFNWFLEVVYRLWTSKSTVNAEMPKWVWEMGVVIE